MRGLPDVRRVLVGWGLSTAGSLVVRVAMLVYTFQAGGAALVAVYGVASVLPAALTTPLVTGLGVRLGLDRLLRGTTALRAVLIASAAVVAAVDLGPALVIGLVCLSASLSGAYRPVQAVMMPWLVRTPAELSRANVRATMVENAAGLLGPAGGGLLLILSGPVEGLFAGAALVAAGALALRLLRLPPEAVSGSAGRGGVRDMLAGAAALSRVIAPGGAIVMTALQVFTRGVLLVLVVVLSIDVLDLGAGAVGWLTAMIGLGGLLGGAVASSLLRVTRLARSFCGGIIMWGLPLVLLGLWPTPATAYLAFFLVGIGNAMEDGGLYTLIPRVVGQRHAAGALSALELVIFVSSALGSLAAPTLATSPGTGRTLLFLGLALLVTAGLYATRCARVDREMPSPGPELELLRGLPQFTPLPLVSVEQLLGVAERRSYVVGAPVMVEGEPAQLFHIIESGTANVTVHGVPRPPLGVGDGFGEIALLRDLPRTATVTAGSELTTLALCRSDFLSAVTGNRVSAVAAEEVANQRLSRDQREVRDPGDVDEPS
jgi:hypothetical protein